ncbi:MAG: type II secretion system F family protein [Patescibacteria group bacterium]|jgi:type IV pilus assembly protein PilC
MIFKYIAYDKLGEIKKGIIDATDEKSAAVILKEKKLVVADITEKKETKNGLNLPFFNKVSMRDKIIFTKELAIMIKSGLSVVDALSSIADEFEKPKFKKIIGEIANDIKGGQSFSKSLAKHPDVFPPLYTSIIKSGEESGKLDIVLLNLSEQLDKNYKLTAKVKSAMTYPALIFVTLLVVATLIMIFVMPQLEKVFNDTGVKLPMITRILLGTSRFLVKYWYILLVAVIALSIGFMKFIKTNSGRHYFDLFKIKAPILGGIFQKIYAARFARSAYTLISSGVPINQIFTTVGQVIDNSIYATKLDKTCEEIKAGRPLSAIFEENKLFPHLVPSLLKVGEKSGKTDYVLETLSDYYESEVDIVTSNLSSIIEPVIMIVLGIGVGFVIISVLMPIYGLVGAM